MSEWLKETGCKPVGSAYAGSNPAPPIRPARAYRQRFGLWLFFLGDGRVARHSARLDAGCVSVTRRVRLIFFPSAGVSVMMSLTGSLRFRRSRRLAAAFGFSLNEAVPGFLIWRRIGANRGFFARAVPPDADDDPPKMIPAVIVSRPGFVTKTDVVVAVAAASNASAASM